MENKAKKSEIEKTAKEELITKYLLSGKIPSQKTIDKEFKQLVDSMTKRLL